MKTNLYTAIWRWHLIAGLFAGPVVIIMAITGSIYLFKPQYEAWRYHDLIHVEPSGMGSPADVQFQAALEAAPDGWKAELFTPSSADDTASVVQFRNEKGESISLFVNPHTLEITGERQDEKTLMANIKRMHGTLLIGSAGDLVVELSASWLLVLLISGLYLWWPRPFRWKGFLLPRFGSGKRALLMDLHAVPMVWFSAYALFLITSGIPWSGIGGKWFQQAGQLLGEWQPDETQASAHRSEYLGGWSPYLDSPGLAKKVEQVASDPVSGGQNKPLSLLRVMKIAEENKVADAFTIGLPKGPTGVYSIFSDRNKAFTRTYLHMDQYSGKVLADVRFKDFGRMAQFFSFGIIMHEGQLFGILNQLAGLFTCIFLIMTIVTGILMWWKRRPPDSFGLPDPGQKLPKGLPIVLICLGALFPLLAVSVIVIAMLDKTGRCLKVKFGQDRGL